MKKYTVHIQQKALLDFEVEVEGENEEEAMKNFEYENSEGHFEDEWFDASDHAEILKEDIQIWEVQE